MTTVAHSALGLLGWQLFAEEKSKKTLLLFFLIASMPDIDFALFFFLGRAGLAFHQYYTHNIFFVVVTAVLFWPLLKSTGAKFAFLGVGCSHLVLDFLTIDGSVPFGIPLFYPFSNHRFNFGIMPNIHKGTPTEIFSLHNLWVIGFEIAIFWVPILLAYRKPLTTYFFQKSFLEKVRSQ